jgi:hypothetical protein
MKSENLDKASHDHNEFRDKILKGLKLLFKDSLSLKSKRIPLWWW